MRLKRSRQTPEERVGDVDSQLSLHSSDEVGIDGSRGEQVDDQARRQAKPEVQQTLLQLVVVDAMAEQSRMVQLNQTSIVLLALRDRQTHRDDPREIVSAVPHVQRLPIEHHKASAL